MKSDTKKSNRQSAMQMSHVVYSKVGHW